MSYAHGKHTTHSVLRKMKKKKKEEEEKKKKNLLVHTSNWYKIIVHTVPAWQVAR